MIYLPSIDILLLEWFSVKLGPGAQMVQPRHNFLWRPAGHGFADQWVMTVNNANAPMIKQHHHLETHLQRSEHSFPLLILYQFRLHYLDAKLHALDEAAVVGEE